MFPKFYGYECTGMDDTFVRFRPQSFVVSYAVRRHRSAIGSSRVRAELEVTARKWANDKSHPVMSRPWARNHNLAELPTILSPGRFFLRLSGHAR